jgi:hypothetical protein
MAGTFVIEQFLREYVADRHIEIGQSVQFGWLIFRIEELGPPIEFASLDFLSMASFTRDLRRAERAHFLQKQALEAFSADAEDCSLWHAALVSLSYEPGHPKAFLHRTDPLEGNHSGWYVGMRDDPLDLNDGSSFGHKSLYELSIFDDRMLPFWLMPVGTIVELESKGVRIRGH